MKNSNFSSKTLNNNKERGAAMVEYGLLLSVFVMVILTALPAFNYALSGAESSSKASAQLYESYPRPLI